MPWNVWWWGLGPNLNRPKLRYGPDLPALIGVISNGIPNTPMPAGWQFSSNDVRRLAGYVLSLGQVPREIVPGDPARGRVLFTGKGECTKCHSVRREGGVQGPDLTDVGLRRGAEFLKQSLLDPGAELPQEMTDDFSVAGYSLYLPVKIVTQEGRELEATRVNEDGFTIQVRDSFNQPFSLGKSELNTLRKEFGKSIMPSYTTTLLPGEIDDLVAYLTTLRGDE